MKMIKFIGRLALALMGRRKKAGGTSYPMR